MPIAEALSAAQEAVVKAEAAASVDIGTAEATAVLGTAQATVAYQLAMQILQDKVVDLAPVLIALEVAAINEGIGWSGDRYPSRSFSSRTARILSGSLHLSCPGTARHRGVEPSRRR